MQWIPLEADAMDPHLHRQPPEEMQPADLARRIVDDVSDLLRGEARRARDEAREKGAASAVLLALAGGGACLSAIGATMLAVAPVARRQTRRRMLLVSLAYLALGGTAAVLGGSVLGETVAAGLRKLARRAKHTGRLVEQQI